MFASNQKISGRQITRLLIFDMAGISTLLLPPILAGLAGGDGIFCILFALPPAYLLVECMARLQKKTGQSYPGYLKKKLGKVCAPCLLLVYYLYGVFLAGCTLYVSGSLIQTSLLHEESYWLITLCLLVLGGYGVLGGIEGRARIYELLFWPLLLPLFIMLVLSLRDVNPNYWTPVAFTGWTHMVQGTLVVFLFYLIVSFILFLKPFETEQKGSGAAAKRALCVTAFLNAAVYLIVLGIFGREELTQMRYPIITLMSMIKLPGGFSERQDAFMVAIWFFTLYALFGSSMFYGTEVLKKMVNKRGKKRYAVVTLALTYGVSALFYGRSVYEGVGMRWFLYVGIVIFVLVPVGFCVFSGGIKKRKIGTACIAFFMTLFLTACNSTELEKREIPLVIALDKAENDVKISFGFQNPAKTADEKTKDTEVTPMSVRGADWHGAFTEGETASPKTMDYNHVKALIISQEILEDEELLGKFLEYIENREVFARNTLLFASREDAAMLLDAKVDGKSSVGMYLEELVANGKEVKNSAAVTLGSLLNDYRNRMENLYIPILIESDEKLQTEEYFVMSGCEPAGVIDRESFLAAMLLEGKLKRYELQTEEISVRLTHIRVLYEYEEREGEMLVRVRVKAEAETPDRRIASENEKEALKKTVTDNLNQRFEELAGCHLWERQLDLTNSFYRLGGYERAAYKKYRNDRTGYCQNLALQISFEITMISE